jgi:hypothetical protein
MILVLFDDLSIGAFDSPEAALKNLEGFDVMNNEYSFCDDAGQRYVGSVTRQGGWLRHEEVALQPEGKPDIENALALLDRAVRMEPNDVFADIESLRPHIVSRRQCLKQS